MKKLKPTNSPKVGEWYFAYLAPDHQTFYYIKGSAGYYSFKLCNYVDVWVLDHSTQEYSRVGCNVAISREDILSRHPEELPKEVSRWYQPTLF